MKLTINCGQCLNWLLWCLPWEWVWYSNCRMSCCSLLSTWNWSRYQWTGWYPVDTLVSGELDQNNCIDRVKWNDCHCFFRWHSMTIESIDDWKPSSDLQPDGFVESDSCESSPRQSLPDLKAFILPWSLYSVDIYSWHKCSYLTQCRWFCAICLLTNQNDLTQRYSNTRCENVNQSCLILNLTVTSAMRDWCYDHKVPILSIRQSQLNNIASWVVADMSSSSGRHSITRNWSSQRTSLIDLSRRSANSERKEKWRDSAQRTRSHDGAHWKDFRSHTTLLAKPSMEFRLDFAVCGCLSRGQEFRGNANVHHLKIAYLHGLLCSNMIFDSDDLGVIVVGRSITSAWSTCSQRCRYVLIMVMQTDDVVHSFSRRRAGKSSWEQSIGQVPLKLQLLFPSALSRRTRRAEPH
jgi:hypothetical protein